MPRIPFSFSTWSADHCVMTTLNRSISEEDCNIESIIVLLLFTNHQDHSWSKLIVLAWEWWRMVRVTMKGIIIIKSSSTAWQTKYLMNLFLNVLSDLIEDRYLWSSACFLSDSGLCLNFSENIDYWVVSCETELYHI